jgi:hypothetical protein
MSHSLRDIKKTNLKKYEGVDETLLRQNFSIQKGIHNGATEALSRMPTEVSPLFAITIVQPSLLCSAIASYSTDTRAQQLLQLLALDPASSHSYTLDHGILC